MASTDHRETEGQSERAILTLIGSIQPTIRKETKYLDIYLPAMKFEIIAARQESTNLSPLEKDFGRIHEKPLTEGLWA